MKIDDITIKEFIGSAPQAILLINSEGRIELINEIAEEVLEYIDAEISIGTMLFGLPWFERDLSGKTFPEKESLAQLLKENENLKESIRGLARKDQISFTWFKINARSVISGKDSAPGFMLCLHDISKEIATQEELSHHLMGQDVLLKISRDLHYLNEDEDLKPILTKVLSETGKLFHSERCFLYYEKATELHLSSFYSREQGDVPPIHCDCSRELFLELKSAYSESTESPMNFWLVDSDEAPEGILDEYMQQEGIRGLLLLPILNMNKKCVGLLGFERFDRSLHFNSTGSRGVEFLADTIGAFFDRYLKAWNLRERVKEMRCLDKVNQLKLNENDDKQAYFQDIVNAILSGFLHPAKTRAVLKAGDLIVASGNASNSIESFSSTLDLNGLKDSYLKIELAEGLQFLKEEYTLIESVAKVVEQEWKRSFNLGELKHSNTRLKRLAQSESFYVIRVNMQGYVTDYSAKYEEDNRWILEGLGKDKFDHHHALDTICEHHHQLTQETVAKCIESPGRIFTVVLDKPAVNNGIKHTFWEFVALVDEDSHAKEIQCFGIDITEIQESKRSLERFKKMSDSSFNASVISNIDGKVEYVNDQFCSLSGLEKESILHKDGAVMFHPDFMKTRKEIRNHLKQKGSMDNQEIDFIFANGREVTVLFSAQVVSSASGNWIYYSLLDINERKRQKMQLLEQKQRLEAIIEAMPDSIFVLDKKGTYLEYYRGVHTNTEDLSHLVGFRVQDAHKPFYAKEFLAKIKQCLEEDKSQTMQYSRMIGNHLNWFEATFSAIDDHRVLKLSRNITFRKEHEEQLQRFNIAIEQSPVGIIITDLEGYIEYASPSMERITGYSIQQLLGMSTRVFSSGKNPPEVYQKLWQTIFAGETWEGELLNRNSEKEIYWERLSISPIRNDKGEIHRFMALKQNIDQERKSQEQLIIQKEIFRDIAHSQSHEVRAPLARILGLVDLLNDRPPQEDKLREELLANIVESSKELDDVIRATVQKVKEAEKLYN